MLVKTLVSTLAAKVGIGVAIATVGMTAAGAAGALPDPVQHAVASVVGATTPIQLPDPATSAQNSSVSQVKDDIQSTVTTVAGTKDADDADETDDATGGTTGTHPDNHGACVSAAAKELGGTGAGKTISSIARSDCGKTDKGTSTTTSSTTSTTSIAGTAGVSNSGKGSGNSGNGNGNGKSGSAGSNGKGNSGKD
jgi:hypothetical protein